MHHLGRPDTSVSRRRAQWIGVPRARQMSVTGDYVFAQQALEWGLVNEVRQGRAVVAAVVVAVLVVLVLVHGDDGGDGGGGGGGDET